MAERTGHASVDLGALRANFRTARSIAGERELIAVVKADAYGHGAAMVSRTLIDAGCTRLAVVDVCEACELREAGISAPVLVLGGAQDAGQAGQAASCGLCLAVHDGDALRLLHEAAHGAGRRLRVQVEVDTGMRRMGVSPDAAPDLMAAIAEDPLLVLEGVYTHFACADDPDPESALQQVSEFRRVLAAARERGIAPGLVHAANSAALLADGALGAALPEATAVRPGLMLYGARTAAHQDPERRLVAVMSVRTRVVAVRDVEAAVAIGYGASYRTQGKTRIATVPIGYADGVLRSLSSRGAVYLAGGVRPIVGRVSMDYLTVDVGDAAVAVGDEVVFMGLPATSADDFSECNPLVPGFGSGPGIAVEDQAAAAGTLAYELLVRVGERLPRRHFERD